LKKEIDNYEAFLFPVSNNESYKAAFIAMEKGLEVSRLVKDIEVNGSAIEEGSFYIRSSDKLNSIVKNLTVPPVPVNADQELALEEIRLPRIALVETAFHDMDAGWTRFVFDEYHIPFTVLKPAEFDKKDLNKEFDIVIFPNSSKNVLLEGKYNSGSSYYISSYPPEFTKGMGEVGMERLMTFLDNGGIIVSWGRSTQLFEGYLKINHGNENFEEFNLPFKNINKELKEYEFFCPGSLLKVDIKKNHPLTYGLKKEIGILFSKRGQVFTTSLPKFDMDRRVIASFPEKDILISGYGENVERIGRKTAMVWLKKGKGQLVLMGFNPQFRASTQGTYKLLFNSLLLDKIN
jgi:hypothetical protein